MSKRDSEILARVNVASPCTASWDAMEGDEQARFCGGCKKNVYNLSAMTAEEAAALVRNTEGRLCVRYYRRTDGTMLTADCPIGASARQARKKRNVIALAGAGAALAAYRLSGQKATEPVAGGMIPLPMASPAPTPEPAMMGKMPSRHFVMGAIAAPRHELGEATMGAPMPVQQGRVGRIK